jgi:hypothetical protein
MGVMMTMKNSNYLINNCLSIRRGGIPLVGGHESQAPQSISASLSANAMGVVAVIIIRDGEELVDNG